MDARAPIQASRFTRIPFAMTVLMLPGSWLTVKKPAPGPTMTPSSTVIPPSDIIVRLWLKKTFLPRWTWLAQSILNEGVTKAPSSSPPRSSRSSSRILSLSDGFVGSIRQQMIERVERHAGVRDESLAGLDEQRSNVLRHFLGETPLMVYRLWVEGGKKIPLTEATNLAVALTCRGMDGYLEATGTLHEL